MTQPEPNTALQVRYGDDTLQFASMPLRSMHLQSAPAIKARDVPEMIKKGQCFVVGAASEPEPTPPQPIAAAPPANDQTAVVHNLEVEKAKRAAPVDATKQQMLAEVTRYMASGLHCIQIAAKGKVPRDDKWRDVRLDLENATSLYLGEPMPNVGVALGENSKGVCDIDLDWPLAPAIAAAVAFGDLPSFGRAGKPMSHRLFKCIDISKDHKETALVKFELPPSECLKQYLPGEHALCVLEIRGNHQQTVFPPSIHSSGEQIAWAERGGFVMPPSRTWKDIVESAGLVAFLTLMATCYPPPGVRNDFSLALGGALIRALLKDYKDDDAGLIVAVDECVAAVCKAAGDQGRGRSWTERAGNTLAKIRGNTPCWELPKVFKILGFDEPVQKRIKQWLYGDADGLPSIIWDDIKLIETLDRAEEALIESGASVYSKDKRLMYVAQLNKGRKYVDDRGHDIVEENGVKRAVGSKTLHDYDPLYLYEKLNAAARWCKVKKVKDELKVVRQAPPRVIANHILARPAEWRFPVLNGIVYAPTMRKDGTIINQEGYDEETGLLVDFGGVEFPPIPDQPTKEDAQAALKRLKWLLAGFAFVPDDEDARAAPDVPSASRSAALALFLTSIVRRILPTAPLFGITAAHAGEGKTLLAEVNGIIATGHIPPHITWDTDPIENTKRLISILYRGDSMVNLDNVSIPLGGDLLDSMLTQETVDQRLLGGNEVPNLSTNTTITAAGINLRALDSQTARRVLLISMNSGTSSPESRTNFAREIDGVDAIRSHAHAERPSYVVDELTVLRAWKLAAARGETVTVDERWGSFEAWSDLVRKALIWAGEPDPCGTREQVREDDPERARHQTLVAAWRDCDALAIGEHYTIGQIAAAGTQQDGAAINTALMGLCPSVFSNAVAGKAISNLRNRVVEVADASGTKEQFSIRVRRTNGVMFYRLERVEQRLV